MTTTPTDDTTNDAIYAVLSAQQTTAGTVNAHQLAADIAAALPTMPDPVPPPPDTSGELIVTGFDAPDTGDTPAAAADSVPTEAGQPDH